MIRAGRQAGSVVLASLASLLAMSLPLGAQPSRAGDTGPGRQDVHGALTLGFLLAQSGPLDRAWAVEAEFFPGAPLDRYGVYCAFRSDGDQDTGMITTGMSFVAGATRPRLVITFHADFGAGFRPAQFAAGGGVRVQIGLWGPLVVAANSTAYTLGLGPFSDNNQIALGITFTAGVAR